MLDVGVPVVLVADCGGVPLPRSGQTQSVETGPTLVAVRDLLMVRKEREGGREGGREVEERGRLGGREVGEGRAVGHCWQRGRS